MKSYTLDDLRLAQAQKNYLLVNQIAVFIMMSRPDFDTHLKVAMACAWSLEQMGAWEQAFAQYELMETLHDTAKMAAYMVTRRARVLRKMGRCEEADKLLDQLSGEVAMTLSERDYAWVLGRIRLARADVDD